MAKNLPPPWQKTLSSEQDISDFAKHIMDVCQFKPAEREFPAYVTFTGVARTLALVEYEAERRQRNWAIWSVVLRFIAGYDINDAALDVAKALGKTVLRTYREAKNRTLRDIRYIQSHYELYRPSNDNGSVLRVSYGNTYDAQNHYAIEPHLY